MGYGFKKKKQYTLHDNKTLLIIFHAEPPNVSFMREHDWFVLRCLDNIASLVRG